MRYLLFILAFSISHSATFFISYDIEAGYSIDYSNSYDDFDERYDTGAIALGLEHNLKNYSIVGLSYHIRTLKDDYSNDGDRFLSLYHKFIAPIDSYASISPWFLLGYNRPLSDLGYLASGIMYGFGAKIPNGLGFSYITHNAKDTEIDIDYRFKAYRISISYQFN